MRWNEELQREIPVGWSCAALGDLLHKNSITFDYQTVEPTIDLSVMPSATIALNQMNSSNMFSTNLFYMLLAREFKADWISGDAEDYVYLGIASYMKH